MVHIIITKEKHTSIFFLPSLTGTKIYGTGESEPCTMKTQFVVEPIPIGEISPSNMAFSVVLFPSLVCPMNATFI